MKGILMVAYHYPPCRGSSGLQRTLSFSRYLPSHGWTPMVLTVNPRAYPEITDDQLVDIPAHIPVKRVFALDTARHLAWRGKYLSYSALPDRWMSWLFGAVLNGLKLIRQYKPKVLWSTHPIPTAHLIGLILRRLTGLPWVADFRDPMTEIDPLTQRRFPDDPTVWKARRWVERVTVEYSSRAVFVAPATLRMYAERYPEKQKDHWVLIANGYNEESFTAAEQLATQPSATEPPVRLLHSGILYMTDRDPSAFFAVLAQLQRTRQISSTNLKIVLRATGYDDHYRRIIEEKGIGNLVTLEPAIPYREALAEMLSAHGLLIFQGQESNANIPAKLYEYLRAQRPIFALVDPEGDTAKTLKTAGVGTIVPLLSEDRIAAGLLEFLQQIRTGTAPLPNSAEVKSYSREAKTQELARLCDILVP